MTMWPVSTRVNKPENDDASLLDMKDIVPKLEAYKLA